MSGSRIGGAMQQPANLMAAGSPTRVTSTIQNQIPTLPFQGSYAPEAIRQVMGGSTVDPWNNYNPWSNPPAMSV
ncbi:unnamed protein product [Sphagnum balticum]